MPGKGPLRPSCAHWVVEPGAPSVAGPGVGLSASTPNHLGGLGSSITSSQR